MSERRKILFIVNPVSGVKKKLLLDDLVSQHFNPAEFETLIYHTTRKGDARERSEKAVSEFYNVVVAVGGDGTINEVAQGLVNTNVPLAVIPRVSGNGFANYFNIPHDPLKALEVIKKGAVKVVDTGRMNGLLFLNVAGLGFDARVSAAFDVFGTRGLLSYMYIALREYFQYKPQRYQITLSEQSLDTEAFLVTAANSSQFGNDAYIAPQAKIDDGLLDLVILKPTGFFGLISISFRLFRGTVHKSNYCDIIKTQSVRIKHSDIEGQIDGEPIKVNAETNIEIVPKSLSVIA